MSPFKKITVVLLALVLGVVTAGKASADAQGRKLYDQTVKGTVLVWVEVPQRGFVPGGTGWVVDASKRWVLTNHHVAKPGTNVRVSFAQRDAQGRPLNETEHYQAKDAIPGRVLRSDSVRDVALIELERLPEGAAQLNLAEDSAQPGDRLFAVGHPARSSGYWILSKGNVRSVLHKTVSYRDDSGDHNLICRMVESDLAANPGDSGSPVLNEEGKVVAIHSGGDGKARGVMSWHIDVSEIRRFVANGPVRDVVLDKNDQLTADDPRIQISDPKSPNRKEHQYKVFTLDLEAGKTYVIDLTSADFDAFVRIDDVNGNRLYDNDDGGMGTNAHIALRPVKSGKFRIIVTSYDGKVGAFKLIVRKEV